MTSDERESGDKDNSVVTEPLFGCTEIELLAMGIHLRALEEAHLPGRLRTRRWRRRCRAWSARRGRLRRSRSRAERRRDGLLGVQPCCVEDRYGRVGLID